MDPRNGAFDGFCRKQLEDDFCLFNNQELGSPPSHKHALSIQNRRVLSVLLYYFHFLLILPRRCEGQTKKEKIEKMEKKMSPRCH